MNVWSCIRSLPKCTVFQRRRATVLILVVVVSILYLGLEISTELMFMREGRISIMQNKQYKVSISIGTGQDILAGID